MSRRVYAGAVGHERTLVLRHEDEGRTQYELVALFQPASRPEKHQAKAAQARKDR